MNVGELRMEEKQPREDREKGKEGKIGQHSNGKNSQ
jgi:hypothetical protein